MWTSCGIGVDCRGFGLIDDWNRRGSMLVRDLERVYFLNLTRGVNWV